MTTAGVWDLLTELDCVLTMGVLRIVKHMECMIPVGTPGGNTLISCTSNVKALVMASNLQVGLHPHRS